MIHSEDYPFENFCFKETNIDDNKFNFPKQLILGKQAEAAFEAYLNYSVHYEILKKNIQIYSLPSGHSSLKKETIGELDYIVKEVSTQKIIHIELACKFYLYDKASSNCEEERWIGPNRKDSLFDKLQKIKYKQFPLIRKEETKKYFKNHDIPLPYRQKLCLKAFLFIPKAMDINTLTKNYRDCIIGYWITYEEFLSLDEDGDFAIRIKKEWLSQDLSGVDWMSFSAIKSEVLNGIRCQNSPLIYKKSKRQVEVFFVVWW